MAAYTPVSIKLELNSPEKYVRLLEFCNENGIYMPPMTSEPFRPVFLNTERRKVTPAFKSFCGPENLLKDGTTTEENAYHTVMRYVSVFKLQTPDATIHFNKALKEAFQTDQSRFYEHEICKMISEVFTKV